jgi:DNA polymerase-1
VVDIDFSVHELVVVAEITQCKLLLSWFREGRDPHKEAAARIFRKPVDQITKDERNVGKAANFSLLYGGGPQTIIDKALEYGTTVSWEDAEAIIAEFFDMFPEIGVWQEAQIERMQQGLPIESVFGRTWLIPLDDRHALNMGLNAPIQSTASDLMLLGLDRAWPLIEAQGQVVTIVHDSITVMIRKGTYHESAWWDIAGVLVRIDPRFLLQLEVACGPSWGETKEMFRRSAASNADET